MRGMRFASLSAFAVAGVVFASACASAATVAPVGPAAGGGPAAGAGAVHFSGLSQNSDGPDFTVVLSGAVGDYGPAVSVHPDGTVDPEHSSIRRCRRCW